MAKPKKAQDNVSDHAAAMRRAAWISKVEDQRDGRIVRAWTQADGRKTADKKACRGRQW